MIEQEKRKIDKAWHSRSPVHELNADSGEDMFYGTMRLCMSEYAKQEAIAFAEWMFDEINPFMKHEGKWVQACGNSTSWTTSQLYNLFKQKQ